VHARFARNLELSLRTPSWLVYHAPYEHAVVRAIATWRGRPIAGADVDLSIRCPLSRVAVTLQTGRDGAVVFPFGTEMRDATRVYECRVRATLAANGRTAAATPATLRFIHPLWLETRTGKGGRIMVRIWGRAGELVVLHANGRHVAHAQIGRRGWVDVTSRRIHRGDRLMVGGRPGHHSHVITA